MGGALLPSAMIDLNPQALRSPTMIKILKRFKKIKSLTDTSAPGRDWNVATSMVIQGGPLLTMTGPSRIYNLKNTPQDYQCLPSGNEENIFSDPIAW